jgi:HEAT repeat protein
VVAAATTGSAVKVVGVLRCEALLKSIRAIATSHDDWRLRLEAMACLARVDPANWTAPILDTARDANNAEEYRIESIFVLSEIPTDEASEALSKVAMSDDEKPTELRAAAVWGLGQGVHPRPDLLLPYVVDDDDLVALHAIAGLPDLPAELLPTLFEWLQQDNRRAAAAAKVLQRHQAVQALLQAAHCGDPGRLWALRALGAMRPELVQQYRGELLSPEIEEYLKPSWIGQADWLRGSGHEGLEALDVQKVRFNPLL